MNKRSSGTQQKLLETSTFLALYQSQTDIDFANQSDHCMTVAFRSSSKLHRQSLYSHGRTTKYRNSIVPTKDNTINTLNDCIQLKFINKI